jgi:hypothetical protein
MNIKKIENWSIVPYPNHVYLAPEARPPCLAGICEGHEIITSPIRKLYDENSIQTINSIYQLGQVDPEYEKMYPGARSRLFNSLNNLFEDVSDV